MEHVQRETMVYIAIDLLGISVVTHLLGGFAELYAIVTGHGVLAYAALMLIGAAIPLVLLGAMVSGVIQPSATYATLSGVMVLYIVAYADVHALGTLESVSGVDLHTHEHDRNGHHDNGHDHNGHDHGGHNHDHGHNGHDHDGHGHGDSSLDTIGEHLVDDPVALLTKVSEGTAAVLFAMLSIRER